MFDFPILKPLLFPGEVKRAETVSIQTVWSIKSMNKDPDKR